jgi:NTE family protein
MNKKKITLALQGGGSHGAFTWGVLETLLEEDLLDITGLCGTSAGALNAAIVAAGMLQNGSRGAIDLLTKFWTRISSEATFSPLQPTWLDKALSAGNMNFSPAYNLFYTLSNYLSPYQWNPLDINPLRGILNTLIDFRELKECPVKLFVCATNVKSGQAKIFGPGEISADSLLASACLPQLYKAVQIENEYYWDGGFIGNPPLFPLIEGTNTSDILLVQINPCRIDYVPQKADEILHRINELSFNSSLIAELKMIEFKNDLLEKGITDNGTFRKIRYHVISGDNILEEFDVSSKSNVSWEFINLLREKGRAYGEHWLKNNYANIGKVTSADFSEEFQKALYQH